jgi:hypothetical protein
MVGFEPTALHFVADYVYRTTRLQAFHHSGVIVCAAAAAAAPCRALYSPLVGLKPMAFLHIVA